MCISSDIPSHVEPYQKEKQGRAVALLQLALSVQHVALEYALFFWMGTSASLWTVCSSVCTSSSGSIGMFQCLSLLAEYLETE